MVLVKVEYRRNRMQLTKTIFQNSAIFIEKKWVANELWGKVGFL